METDSIERVSRAYAQIQLVVGQGDSGGKTPIDLDSVNKRIVQALEEEISGKTSRIRALASQGLEQARNIIPKVEGFVNKAEDGISRLPDTMGLRRYTDLRANIDQLLTSFREIAEDPSLIFPRCSCVDVPVDPAKLINFKRQFRRLERLNDADFGMRQEERSMSSPPQRAREVITNVQNDLESLTENVRLALEDLQRMEDDAEQLFEVAKGFMRKTKTVNDVAKSVDAIQNVVCDIISMFSMDATTTAERSTTSLPSSSALECVQVASGKVQEMITTSKQLEDSVSKVSELCDSFTKFMERLVEYSSVSCQRISNIIRSLHTFSKNLPRFARELQAFFVPSGLSKLILKSSDELKTMTDSMEALKGMLAAQEEVAQSAILAVTEGCFENNKDLGLHNEIAEMKEIPRLLIREINQQDVQKTMYETVEKAIETMIAEIGSSALGGAVDGVLGAIGHGGIVNDLEKHMMGVTESVVAGGGECVVSSAVGLVDNLVSIPWASANPFA